MITTANTANKGKLFPEVPGLRQATHHHGSMALSFGRRKLAEVGALRSALLPEF
jgi:hypothetical protein